MQEEEKEEITVTEILVLMTEKMLRLEKELERLNEKQNRDSNKELPEDIPTDSSAQIPLTGLDN